MCLVLEIASLPGGNDTKDGLTFYVGNKDILVERNHLAGGNPALILRPSLSILKKRFPLARWQPRPQSGQGCGALRACGSLFSLTSLFSSYALK